MKFDKGFSLLELVLAIAIFALGSVALATMLIDSNISTKLSSERIEALFYAKESVGAVRAIRDGAWADLAVGDHGLSDSGGAWAFSGSSDVIDSKYTRVVSVAEGASSTKDITVDIEWNVTPSRTANVVLNTVLADWVALATTTSP